MKRRYQVCMAVPLVFEVEAWTPEEAHKLAGWSPSRFATAATPPDDKRHVLWTQERSMKSGETNGR